MIDTIIEARGGDPDAMALVKLVENFEKGNFSDEDVRIFLAIIQNLQQYFRERVISMKGEDRCQLLICFIKKH